MGRGGFRYDVIMSDADCTPGREPRSVAASPKLFIQIVRETSAGTVIVRETSAARYPLSVLCNRAGHYIFALWFLLAFYLFPRLFSAVADWMSTILPHMVWP